MSSPISVAAMMAYRSEISDQRDLFPNFCRVRSLDNHWKRLAHWRYFKWLCETAARPIHHNAVMLIEKRGQRQQMQRPGASEPEA
jgi:hypothetical protein